MSTVLRQPGGEVRLKSHWTDRIAHAVDPRSWRMALAMVLVPAGLPGRCWAPS
jgi:hypothetical protein